MKDSRIASPAEEPRRYQTSLSNSILSKLFDLAVFRFGVYRDLLYRSIDF